MQAKRNTKKAVNKGLTSQSGQAMYMDSDVDDILKALASFGCLPCIRFLGKSSTSHQPVWEGSINGDVTSTANNPKQALIRVLRKWEGEGCRNPPSSKKDDTVNIQGLDNPQTRAV